MKKVFFAAIAAMVMVSVSNVFASNKMMGNSSAAPVDTVAPTTPTDSTVTDTPVTPQAGSEDDTTKQETPTETNTESKRIRDARYTRQKKYRSSFYS